MGRTATTQANSSSTKDEYHVELGKALSGNASLKIPGWLPTGCHTLDLGLSGGKGLPGGRITEIYGPPGAGKSVLAAMIGAEAQAQGGHVTLIDVERRASEGLYIMAGMDVSNPSKIAVEEVDTLDELLDLLTELIGIAVKHQIKTKNARWMVFIVDSITPLDKEEVAAESMQHTTKKNSSAPNKPMSVPERWATWYRKKAIKQIKHHKIILIFINQIRQHIDMTGRGAFKKFAVPTGWAGKHMATCRIEVDEATIEKEDREKMGEESFRFPVGKYMSFRVEKTCGPADRWGEIAWLYASGPDESWTWFNFLSKYERIIHQPPNPKTGNKYPAGWYEFQGTVHTKKEWIDKIRTDPMVAQQFKNAVTKTYMAQSLLGLQSEEVD